MEHGQWEALTAYLQAHPLVALILAVLAVMLVGSLLRKLIKLAVLLIVVILIGMYWTHRQADADWAVQAERLRQRAGALSEEALKKGRDLLDQGKRKLRKQMAKPDE